MVDGASGGITLPGGVAIPAGELRWQFSRSSGPGGQSVNTADSRASLSFDLAHTQALPTYLHDRALANLKKRLVDGVITVHSEEERSQYLNRLRAQDRLTQLLRDAMKPPAPKRRATKPSKASGQRRIDAKKQRGVVKKLRRNIED